MDLEFEDFEVGVPDFPYQNNRDLWSAAVKPGSRTSRTKKIALHEKWPSSFVYQPKSREFVLEVREGLNFAVWGQKTFLTWRKYFLVGCAHMVHYALYVVLLDPTVTWWDPNFKTIVGIFHSANPPQNRVTASSRCIFS